MSSREVASNPSRLRFRWSEIGKLAPTASGRIWAERIFDPPIAIRVSTHSRLFIWVRAHVAAPAEAVPSFGTKDAPCRLISATSREASGT